MKKSNYFYLLKWSGMESVIARVKKIYPIVTKPVKSWDAMFASQKVLIEFNENADIPSRIVLDQAGNKGIDVVSVIKEGFLYEFFLNYRATEWTNPVTWEQRIFWDISAWKVKFLDSQDGEDSNNDLPF